MRAASVRRALRRPCQSRHPPGGDVYERIRSPPPGRSPRPCGAGRRARPHRRDRRDGLRQEALPCGSSVQCAGKPRASLGTRRRPTAFDPVPKRVRVQPSPTATCQGKPSFGRRRTRRPEVAGSSRGRDDELLDQRWSRRAPGSRANIPPPRRAGTAWRSPRSLSRRYCASRGIARHRAPARRPAWLASSAAPADTLARQPRPPGLWPAVAARRERSLTKANVWRELLFRPGLLK
jgi:hypothetical protein